MARILKCICLTLLLIQVLSLSSLGYAQVVLLHDHPEPLPRFRRPIVQPERSYRIKELAVNSKIDGQVAVTQVSQTFVNTGRNQIEASFVFPLPYDGAVDQMTFIVDGKEFEAKLLSADKAREIYEGYMRRNQDPALLEWLGHGMFKTSVFPIPAGAERTVEIRYTQLLRQDSGINDYLVPLSTAKYTDKPIEKFSVRTVINTQDKLKSIYSPTHEVQIDRSGDHTAVVKVQKTQYIPSNDVRIMYSTDNQSLGANLISHWNDPTEHGYFTLLVSPEIKRLTETKTRKTIIFVVDRSGSMNGKKIEQAREAAKFVLNNLNEGDLFNVISYASDVEAFEPELQAYDSQTRTAALGYVEGIFAGGSTNIDGALTKTFEMIGEGAGPTYVVFLTDGLPTRGEVNELTIASNARQKNKQNARLISFGVGFDVNSRLLDRLTRENNGLSQYVRPDEDLEEHVSRLYSKISAPVLTDVKIQYSKGGTENSSLVNRVYPGNQIDLFAGQQLVLVGRYRESGPTKLTITGKLGDQEKSYDYDITFAEQSSADRYGFCARLWAARRIGEIIDLIDLEGKNPELIQELINLSTKHGIVTRYTSYLADDLAQARDLSDRERSFGLVDESLNGLANDSGQEGFAMRGAKQRLKFSSAPSSFSQDYEFGSTTRDSSAGSRRSIREVVRNAGSNNAYLRGNLLIASNATDVDLDKDKDQITELVRFSTEYFELIKSTSKEENQLLALQGQGEELLVRLQGKIYRLK